MGEISVAVQPLLTPSKNVPTSGRALVAVPPTSSCSSVASSGSSTQAVSRMAARAGARESGDRRMRKLRVGSRVQRTPRPVFPTDRRCARPRLAGVGLGSEAMRFTKAKAMFTAMGAAR